MRAGGEVAAEPFADGGASDVGDTTPFASRGGSDAMLLKSMRCKTSSAAATREADEKPTNLALAQVVDCSAVSPHRLTYERGLFWIPDFTIPSCPTE